MRRAMADYSELFSRVDLDLGQSPDSLNAMPTDRRLLHYFDTNAADPDLRALLPVWPLSAHQLLRTMGVPPISRASGTKPCFHRGLQLHHQHQS